MDIEVIKPAPSGVDVYKFCDPAATAILRSAETRPARTPLKECYKFDDR